MNNRLSLIAILSASIFAASCASGPYKAANKSYKKQAKTFAKTLSIAPVTTAGADSMTVSNEWVGTTNFNLRKPNYVIIHHTAQKSTQETLKTFTTVSTQVSAHYVIGKDGVIHHMLNDYLRAWHAGVAKWGNATDINSSSIGIEIDNDGYQPFSDAQIASLIKLLGNLKKNYGVPTANFIGHSDIAPGRKVDPNANFPWKTLAQKGFGLWYDDVLLDSVPPEFNPIEALRIIGYDIKNPATAISSFKLHFIQTDKTAVLTDQDKRVLFNLYKKYL